MSAIRSGAMKSGFPVKRQYSSNEMPIPTWGLNSTLIYGTRVPMEEPSTASRADPSPRGQDGMVPDVPSTLLAGADEVIE
jgi:hypothetical protein